MKQWAIFCSVGLMLFILALGSLTDMPILSDTNDGERTREHESASDAAESAAHEIKVQNDEKGMNRDGLGGEVREDVVAGGVDGEESRNGEGGGDEDGAAKAPGQRLPTVVANDTSALPEAYLDTAYAEPVGGKRISVRAGDDLQAAINVAQPGDVVVVEAGATFHGNFVLPKNPGPGWIYIISSALAQLPAEGQRVYHGDAQAGQMPKLVSSNKDNTIKITSGASRYRLVGLEIASSYAAADVYYNVIYITDWAEDIVIDRCYIHGSQDGNTFDGIYVNSAKRFGIIDSYISEIHVAQNQAESHGIQVSRCEGPSRIENNYIEAAGINLLFGDNGNVTPVVNDVIIRKNHLYKPPEWKQPISRGPNAAKKWKVKNLLEFKGARRFYLEGNVLENSWPHAQNGSAIVMTPRGGNLTDLTFVRNVVRGSNQGFHINPADPNRRIDRVLIEDNLLHDIDRRFFLVGRAAGEAGTHLVIRHNTGAGTKHLSSGIMFFEGFEDGRIIFDHFTVMNNIFDNGRYGILGTEKSAVDALNAWFTNFNFANNLTIGQSRYPKSHFKNSIRVADNAGVGFQNLLLSRTADFRLRGGSDYVSAGSDGKALGADIDALLMATDGVRRLKDIDTDSRP